MKHVIKTPVKHITADSRQVKQGSLFLAYPGDKTDGRNYIADAIGHGASAVLWDPLGETEETSFQWKPEWAIENLPIKKLRLQAGNIANQFYKQPSTKMWMIGVTGTNGKTSVTQWLSQCFNHLDRKTAVIGTLGNGFPSALTVSNNTTPDAIVLQGMLAQYQSQQAEIVAMEVSSHGIHQGRINGVNFDVAVLTNLSRDHLDYHGTLAEYAAEKRRLFDASGLKTAVLNCDDDFGQEIEDDLKYTGTPVVTYGINHGDVKAIDIKFENNGFSFTATTPQGNAKIKASLIGRFNVYNILAVLAVLLVSKVSLKDAVHAIAHIQSAKGRMQQIGGKHLPLVVVDYAHTPDALEKVLTTLKEQLKESAKLVCVFGCGGNRDAGKRELMGKIASDIANVIFITSDNPRYENKRKIIHEILHGVQGNYIVEEDRAKAIDMAILAAKVGDIVLIAGKGHEEYQDIGGQKFPFSDIDQAHITLKKLESISS